MKTDDNRTRITMLTGSYRIKGTVELVAGARLTDYMTEAKAFFAVTDAEVWELTPGGRQVLSAPFINVSREHVEVVTLGH